MSVTIEHPEESPFLPAADLLCPSWAPEPSLQLIPWDLTVSYQSMATLEKFLDLGV